MYVTLLLDKTYVKPQLFYKNLMLTGSDDDHNLTTPFHCFMISSLMSKQKDVVKLVPEKTMKASRLLTFLKSVLFCIVFYRQAIQLFVLLPMVIAYTKNSSVYYLVVTMSSIFHLSSKIHFDIMQKIFMLFDSVHILKGIRNIWINLKNYKKSFSFPSLSPAGLIEQRMLRASFAKLEHIYITEMDCSLKKAPSLSWKALHPHSLERQCVSLALKVFTITNAAALQYLGPFDTKRKNWEETSTFIILICKWWPDIVNAQHSY